jgi:hypothetical protein
MFFNNSKCCQNQNNWQQSECCNMDGCGCGCGPIVEPVVERCVERNICHQVEHVCPIHTRIINNHIIEHVYRPEYTCSEENTVTNIDPGCSGQNF